MVERGSKSQIEQLTAAYFAHGEYVGLEYLSDGTVRVVPADQY